MIISQQTLPFFLFDLSSKQLITSPIIPGDISDTKDIVLAEQSIPGLTYQPIQSGGMGNRKVSFTLNLIKRNGIVGNVNLLKQFDNLRHASFSYKNISQQNSQFTPNPKVLYNWGIGSAPLVWYVKKCDPTHKQHWVNAFGQPQYSEISIELILDETNPLNKVEDMMRQVASIAGMAEGIESLILDKTKRKPY